MLPKTLVRCLSLLILVVLVHSSASAQGFVVKDITITGLQRVEPGTVFAAIPTRVGDVFEVNSTAELIATIYRLRLFDDVRIQHDEGELIIEVVERPGIAEIVISGNDTIPTDEMREGLETINIATGRIYDQAVVERLQRDLKQRYYTSGKYDARIDVRIEELDNNLVNIYIDIHEGENAKIRKLEIVGNHFFDEDTLLDDFQSKRAEWYDFLVKQSAYSRAALSADIENLNDTYYNYGFLDFDVEDVRVTLTPDKRYIDILIKVREGKRYRINDVHVSSAALRRNKSLLASLPIKKGQVFSRTTAIEANNVLTSYLKDRGYAFAQIDVIPSRNPEDQTVDITFFVTPNRRTYVRRIEFSGSDTTDDSTYRHELRQLEASPYSQKDIELSRRRLQRLPYVTSVNIEERAVAGSVEEVDLHFKMEERQSGSFNLGAGYSNGDGVVLNFSVNQDNFLGTGNRINFAFNNSDSNKTYAISLFDPYFTVDGISRAWQLSYTSTDFSARNTTGSDSDEFNAGISFGIPISEEDTFGIGLRFQHITLATASSSTRVQEFIEREGNSFNNVVTNLSFVYDTRDRSLFTTSGGRYSSSFELFVPGSGLSYLKAQYNQRNYIALDAEKEWIFAPGGNVAYSVPLAGTSEVPFYDRYYAGGTSSVRGYQSNTLSARPEDRDAADRALGGEFRLISNMDLYFPTGWLYDPKKLRIGVFNDFGNVYRKLSNFSVAEMRGAFGINMQWLTALGAISINFARPYNDRPEDKTESFQLDLGGSF